MTRLFIHVEGQTEERFVSDVLAPHLYQCGYESVSARLFGNARLRSKRGGVKPWGSVRQDILRHLKEDSRSISTTMVDFYGMPETGSKAWPGRDVTTNLAVGQKATAVADAIKTDICKEMGASFDVDRFIPYIMMHEFEGLLFSSPIMLAKSIGRAELSSPFMEIRNQFASPEEINDSPSTSPSHRIVALAQGYHKPLHGSQAASAIGLEVIRQECPIFGSWLEKLESYT
ncbi:MAG: DUF4276 family protein [Chloroflexi bacterium]|nr:DUF4276 family protein [Chloroflexota bacterium]MDA1226556.1 DUF4276 family protein [Chloroflexota bacterium]